MSNKKKIVVIGYGGMGGWHTEHMLKSDVVELAGIYDITPIMSEGASSIDSRFGKSEDFIKKITEICGKEPITTIAGAEPIGPKALLDVLLIEPCTGNTLGKLANGITDTAVTMAAKAHLRNGRPHCRRHKGISYTEHGYRHIRICRHTLRCKSDDQM